MGPRGFELVERRTRDRVKEQERYGYQVRKEMEPRKRKTQDRRADAGIKTADSSRDTGKVDEARGVNKREKGVET
jgi:hypothetical protein